MTSVGAAMHELMEDLYPICRSITGDGVRETLRRLQEVVPVEIHEVPTGTPVFDWTVPEEWNIRDGWIRGPDGEKVVDFAESNLHVMSYSVPVRETLSREELADHVHTLPEFPDRIPYRTSYYSEDWAFCMEHRRWEGLPAGQYEVCIDSELAPGSLTYGEYLVEGRSDGEVLVSTHVCHPSLCNDNLSGIVVAALLAREMEERSPRYSYRFVWTPVTIGAITWLARNEDVTPRIEHGLVLACLGDPGDPHYKRSRRGDAEIDRAAEHVLVHDERDHGVQEFSPYGYDERQYCSPGFDLPVGCLMRTPHGQFDEYHTSADDLDFVTPEALATSLGYCRSIVEVLEGNRRYRNLNPRCEPRLGARGLMGSVGGSRDVETHRLAISWVLNLSDGDHDLLDIAERAGLSFGAIREAADALLDTDLLEPWEES